MAKLLFLSVLIFASPGCRFSALYIVPSAHMLIICYAVHRALVSSFNKPTNNSLNKPFFRFTFVFIASTLQIMAYEVLEAFIFNTFCRTIYSQFDIRRLPLLRCYDAVVLLFFVSLLIFGLCTHIELVSKGTRFDFVCSIENAFATKRVRHN